MTVRTQAGAEGEGATETSRHHLVLGDSRRMESIPDSSVHLVLTSPPYPMIEMWDPVFRSLSTDAGRALDAQDGPAAFDAMHRELDRVWAQCLRVLVPGGFACINVGDATRTVGGAFCLYPNQARIVTAMGLLGFTPLPDILWRKPSNAPNKFMGSGMLPAGAYVTYEHEYILIFRKGGKRSFISPADRSRRNRSAYFWEERNTWFSDVWTDLGGTRQRMDRSGGRERSGAFPFELPYRILQMYSVQGDRVLDPFAGTGTTLLAAAASARDSVGLEIAEPMGAVVASTLEQVVPLGNARIDERLRGHQAFVESREAAGKPLRHRNTPHGFAVMTRQESEMVLLRPLRVHAQGGGRWVVEHGLGGG